MRHHGAVQAEQQPVDRQRRLELAQDLVAHDLVVGAVGRAGRAGGKAAALDQLEAFLLGARPADEQRRGAHARRIGRMLAGAEEHRLAVALEAGRQRREGVGLGGERGGEQTHADSFRERCRPGRPAQWCAIAPGVVSQIASRCARDVAQRALEMPQAMRLADDVGMQRHAHHQRPRLRQLEHLVELVDDHVGEVGGALLAARRWRECRSAPADRARPGCACRRGSGTRSAGRPCTSRADSGSRPRPAGRA